MYVHRIKTVTTAGLFVWHWHEISLNILNKYIFLYLNVNAFCWKVKSNHLIQCCWFSMKTAVIWGYMGVFEMVRMSPNTLVRACRRLSNTSQLISNSECSITFVYILWIHLWAKYLQMCTFTIQGNCFKMWTSQWHLLKYKIVWFVCNSAIVSSGDRCKLQKYFTNK
jgi:hypothetical protein